MKKYINFALIFVFALGLFVSYNSFTFAVSNNYQVFEAGEHDISIDLQTTNNHAPFSYTSSSPIYWVKTYNFNNSTNKATYRQDYIISKDNFTLRYNNSGSISSYYGTRLVAPSGYFYFYRMTNSPNIPNSANSYGFRVKSQTISGSGNVPDGFNENNFDDFIEHVISGNFPDSLGGIYNPLSNPAIGNMVDLQNTYITYDKSYSDLFNSEIPTTSYINFNWGNKTNNGYNLTDYNIQYFATGTILKDNGANGVLEIPVRYSNGNNNFNMSFSNKWDFVVDWTDILDSAGLSYTTTISEVTSSRPLAQSYYTNGLKFSFRPVLKINEKYYAGQWTQVTIVNNGVNGSIFTENIIIDTDGTRPSNNQNGTGVNNNPNGAKNPYDDFINGSSSDYDFSGFIDTTNSILDQIRGIPRIFGLIFSWLPSWVLDMFSMMIGFFILAILVSIVIKVVT